ncbi:MAG TPA: hypothetical protein VIO64_10725 [Pseudobacteroides sp.]|uniref:hypothetical protein n=1 Tax=Pseudobacteroides sp. TaxID=1968840 RepID=UPI002F957E62
MTKHKKEVEEVEEVKQETPVIEAPKMVKVTYKTLEAGPEGSIYPGQTIEVTEEKAAELVDGGYVEII